MLVLPTVVHGLINVGNLTAARFDIIEHTHREGISERRHSLREVRMLYCVFDLIQLLTHEVISLTESLAPGFGRHKHVFASWERVAHRSLYMQIRVTFQSLGQCLRGFYETAKA